MLARTLRFYNPTRETQQALVKASQWTLGNGHPFLCAGHVLLGLTCVKKSVAGQVLDQAHITSQEIIEGLAYLVDLIREAENPDEEEDVIISVLKSDHGPEYPLPGVVSVLKNADQLSAEDGYPCISTGHILLVILEQTMALQLLIDKDTCRTRNALVLATRTLLSALGPPLPLLGSHRFCEFHLNY